MKEATAAIHALRAKAQQMLRIADALAQLNVIVERHVERRIAKRHLSAAGRRAIVRAQKARWAKIRAAKGKKG